MTAQSQRSYVDNLSTPPPPNLLLNGNYVRVFWTNKNAERSFDETWVYRNGLNVGNLLGTTATFTDGPLAEGTYAYQVRHLSPASPGTLTGRPNSPYSVDSVITVGAPPLSASISGPDLIEVSGTYKWTTTVTGGTPPYRFRWFYYRSPGPEQPVGGDDPRYSRFVQVEANSYLFRLTDSVTDASMASFRALYFVEVIGSKGGARALASSPVLWLDGTCALRPPSGRLRQAWLEAFFRAGRAPEPCVPREP